MYSSNGKVTELQSTQADTGDILPHSLDAERAVLGAVLIDPDAFYLVDTVIGADDFYSSAHGQIYKSLVDLYAARVAVDLLTLTETLKRRGLTGCHGKDIDIYCIELLNEVPTAINAPDYARIVESDALRRRLILAGRKISSLGAAGESPAKLIEESERALFAVTQKMATVNVVTSREAISELIDHTQNRINNPDSTYGVKTGFVDLDRVLDGLKPDGLYILAARPGMGKSMLESQIATNCAKRHGAVARFNLEMGRLSLTQRMAASETRIPFKKVEKGQLNAAELRQFYETAGMLSDLPIFIDDSAGLTMSQLTAKARRLHAEHGLKLITLDYLQLMAVDKSYGNRVQDVGQISRGLKRLAKELHTPILALAQLSRSCEARGDKRPMLSDLRDSGEIEQDADAVVFIYRDDYYNPETSDRPNTAEVNIAKHRNGETGSVDLHFNGAIMRFDNRERNDVNL
ncbi:MAG: replicative DNA helicase [Opitutae bacterium]